MNRRVFILLGLVSGATVLLADKIGTGSQPEIKSTASASGWDIGWGVAWSIGVNPPAPPVDTHSVYLPIIMRG